MADRTAQLRQLASDYGVQTSYLDVRKRRRTASPDTLLAVLAALGAGVRTLEDVPRAARQLRQEAVDQVVEPVLVAWEGELASVEVAVAAGESAGRASFELALDAASGAAAGGARGWTSPIERVGSRDDGSARGRCAGPGERLPWGYHRLAVRLGSQRADALVISAPVRSYVPDEAERCWGVFVPLYALHSQDSWGAGNLHDLKRLWGWVRRLDGHLVATLPLLATYLDIGGDPSPYAPVSRLFWNDFYVDPREAPELAISPVAREMVEGAELHRQLDALRAAPLVDYRRQFQLQHRVLWELAQATFERGGERREQLEAFRRRRPDVDRYARFRAVCQRQQSDWLGWPAALRSGELTGRDFDERDWRFHVYAQWRAHEQIHQLTDEARQCGPGLYLDLPLGVHRGGYDTWCEPEAFALEASAGAPPDAFFGKGQDWGLPPLDPRRQRRQHYRYWIALIRHHLQHAGMLRLDHVMGLHRLYWVPQGHSAQEGAYVRYPAEELYAILCLESRRAASVVVGENLGTVPDYVNRAMRRHRVGQMYVLQYESHADADQPLDEIPAGSVASLNTHDMPTFAAFWQGRELDDLGSLGQLSAEDVERVGNERARLRARLADYLRGRGYLAAPAPSVSEVLDALHALLADSRAGVVLINLEDLWLETQPQNVPGTTSEQRPNWQRRARYSVEQIVSDEQLAQRLARVAALRGSKKRTK